MSGHDPNQYHEDKWDLLVYAQDRKEALEYIKITTIISAIISAGRIAAGGDAGDSLKNSLQNLRSILFPEIEIDLKAKASENLKILEKEYKKGPLKVKARDYDTKRKRKR